MCNKKMSDSDTKELAERVVGLVNRLEEENKQLREFVKMIANGRTNDPESAVIHLKIHSNAAKEMLNK